MAENHCFRLEFWIDKTWLHMPLKNIFVKGEKLVYKKVVLT